MQIPSTSALNFSRHAHHNRVEHSNVFFEITQSVRKVGDESCEAPIINQLQQHTETNSDSTDIVPNDTADWSEDFLWKSIWLYSEIHKKIEGVKFVSFFIKIARNW